jgi:integrase
VKLTQSAVDKLKLPVDKETGKQKADHIEWDDALPGFGVRVREGGSRVYVCQYKVGLKTRRLTLGSTKKLTLEQARKEGKKQLAKVAAGGDPQGEKAKTRATATETFKAIAEDFITHQTGRLRPSTLYATRHYLVDYCRRLHDLKIEVITRREVASVLATIAADHGPVAADRGRSALSAMFAWAVGAGLVDSNPVIGTNKHAGAKSRDRVLSNEELAKIWLALDDNNYGRVVKLLILTGQRRDEIADLRRSEIGSLAYKKDGKEHSVPAIELPAERTKNHRPHVVPLSDAAKAIVDEQATPLDFLFGSRRFSGFSGFSKSKAQLNAKLPDLAPWQLHDIRRSVATGMAELGVEPHIVEAILNHVSGHKSGVAGTYNKAVYLKPKTEALALWANHVAVAVAQASGANIHTLARSGTLARIENRH